MQIVKVEQGTEEWLKARSGIPTASEFSKLITPLGKPSTSINGYVNQVLAEIIVGGDVETWEGNKWTERGNELEPEAVEMYEFTYDVEVEEIGFCKDDDNKMGCSPDRLVGEEGLLEIKCPAPATHVDYLLNSKLPNKYIPQVQGQMLVTGRKWCDWMSYHPEMLPVIIRVERDEDYINSIRERIVVFKELIKHYDSFIGVGN